MTTNTNGHQAGPDDFTEVISYGFRLISRFFSFLKAAFVKNLLLILCFSVAGIALGVLKYYISKPIYKGYMQVTQTELSTPVFIKKIQTINDLIDMRSYHQMATKLSIPYAMATSINDISIRPIDFQNDSIGNYSMVFELTDNSKPEVLQAGLMKYLNDFNYINQQRLVQRRLYREKVVFIDKQLAQLDSFKAMYTKSQLSGNSGNVNLSVGNDNTSDLFKQSIELINERQKLVEKLDAHEDLVYVTDSFSISEKPYKGGLVSNSIKFFLGGLLLGYLVAIISLLNAWSRNTQSAQ